MTCGYPLAQADVSSQIDSLTNNYYQRCTMTKKKKPNPVHEKFARELEMWAGDNEERETLVKWLLTRTVSHGFEGTGTKGKFILKRTDIKNFDIKKAVVHAMADCKPNPGLSTTGWVRGGPTWPKAYGSDMWLKAYGC